MLRRLLEETVASAVESGQRAARTSARLLEQADVGVGPLRLTPQTYDRVRRFTAARIRDALEVPHAADLPSALRNGRRHPDPEASFETLLGQGDRRPRAPLERVRERFAALLEQSLDPDRDDGVHPGLVAIIDQMAPDEARIVRLLATEGPQPTVAVSATPRIGRGRRVLAEGLSLIPERAGCSRTDAGPAYLGNLRGLGLVSVDDDELLGHDDYELIEVSEPASAVIRHIEEDRRQRARCERRTTRLSPLGDELIALCLPEHAER